MPYKTTRLIDWGDCDAAGIVFYPNYFRWMDGAFHAMTRAAGFDQRILREEYGLVGTPLVSASAQFRSPAAYGDLLDIDVTVTRLGRSSMSLRYSYTHAGRLILTGEESRVFGIDRGAGLATAPIPAPIRAMLEPFAEA